jgi:excisionase family DNA binding protein
MTRVAHTRGCCAEVLGVTRRWVVEAATRGELPGMKLGPYWRFDARDLEAWIDRQRTAAPEAAGL